MNGRPRPWYRSGPKRQAGEEQPMPTTREHIRRIVSVTFVPLITFVAGASVGLVVGFLIAWLLCLKLLAILVLIPLGPYP